MTRDARRGWLAGLLCAGLLAMAAGAPVAAWAEETAVEKAQSYSEKSRNEAKKSIRKHKKRARDATGNKDVTRDVKEGAQGASEDIGHSAKDVKRKAD